MKQPVFDQTKLPEAMKLIDQACCLMDARDYADDETAKQALRDLEAALRKLAGNPQLRIRDYKDYQASVGLEMAAKSALLSPPVRENLSDDEIRQIVLHILEHDEAETDWWLLDLQCNTGLENLTDYIFYPDTVGLCKDASLQEIADKIVADRT